MASNLTPAVIAAPGFYGLNTQDSPTDMPTSYSLMALNAVIDNYGRLAARKGWEALHSTVDAFSGFDVASVGEYVTSNADVELLFVANNSIYTLPTGVTEPILLYSDTNWISNYWKMVSFNDKMYFFQRGEVPLVYDGNSVYHMTSDPDYAGTVQNANEVLSAYGRLWTADTDTDRTTIKWSDTLIGAAWTGGASGTLNMETIYTNGTSPIVALAAFNGYLIVFCENAIAIFQGADEDPSTNIALVDVIDGVGCVARDSVIDVGTDIFFLSSTGVRSLGRVIDQKSAPIFDISQNVRDSLMQDVAAVDVSVTIKAAYNPVDGFYVLSLPERNKSYIFDLKKRLENNVCRATTWNLAPTSMCLRRNNDLVFGLFGSVGKYAGYSDNGSAYKFLYRSSYWNHEDPNIFKILKQIRLLAYGGAGYRLAIRWGLDFDGLDRGTTVTFPTYGSSDEYNIDEYGNAKYFGIEERLQTVKENLSGAGRVYQIEVDTFISSYPFSLQEITVFAKPGRVHNI